MYPVLSVLNELDTVPGGGGAGFKTRTSCICLLKRVLPYLVHHMRHNFLHEKYISKHILAGVVNHTKLWFELCFYLMYELYRKCSVVFGMTLYTYLFIHMFSVENIYNHFQC